MTLYFIIEHDNTQIKPSTYNVLQAALQLSNEVVAVVAGFNCSGVAKAVSTLKGIAKVLIADNKVYEHPLPERLTPLVLEIANNAEYIIAGSTTFGKNLLPRIAASLDVEQVSDVIEISSGDTFKRPIYAGNAIETVKSNDQVKCLTIRATAFALITGEQAGASIEAVDFVSDNQQSQFVNVELHNQDKPDLSSAEVVISGGRGLQNKDGFARLAKIAERLGAAVGATRAAVDSELAPNDSQVGQTGQVVAPKLYIALGISGAIQHLAGMKDSKIIVAINKDPDAPIFQVADYGLVADINEVFPEWESVLTEMGY